MQNSEKLCLKWNEFQENLNSSFVGFRNDQDFADVTLVCEDSAEIETHKVVLASSSPFFMEMLKKRKHPHPMIYMKGVKGEDQCGKEGQWQNIKTHIEANHIASNISYSCDICGKVSRSRHGLRLHKARDHCKQILLQDQGQLA